MSLSERFLETVNSLLISLLDSNRYTRKIIQRLGEPYLAGHSLDEGLEAIRHSYQRRQRYSTFDILGEEARTPMEGEVYLDLYRWAILCFHKQFWEYETAQHPHQKPVSISVKPSSLGVVTERNPVLRLHEDTSLSRQLEKIVKFAYDRNLDVTLDMEDHCWTDKSLEVAQDLWKRGAENLGIVLQSRLYRTEQDIQHYLLDSDYPFPKEKVRVRMCLGAYNEPEEIATRKKLEMKARLVQHVDTLLRAGVYTEIATHDPLVIDYLQQNIIFPQQISPERYEFQFLRGVYWGERMGRQLREAGYVVRDYMPVELSPGEGTAYMLRRLKANPGLLWNGVKNVAERMVRRR